MGLDGGTIVSRSDVLRGQSWRVAQNDTSRSTRGGNVSRVPQEAADKALERSTAWSTCALSSQPLRPPIVACGLGRLYNKDALLQFLLAKRGRVSQPEELLQYANQLRVAAGGLDHINSLKDVLEVHLHRDDNSGSGSGPLASDRNNQPPSSSNPSTSAPAAAAAKTAGEAAAPFVCPITLLPCDRHPCSALRPCGHVLSNRALQNIRGDGSCPMCGAGFISTLPIHGSPEQVGELREQLRASAAAAAAAKPGKQPGSKKRKAAEAEAEAAAAHEARN
ncbi:hypothetical protein PLESTM_000376500 [Pleodorina starrii]|nr:hypothetical protein PLESTM_000376500 [Pleodorina starrii]